MTTTASPITRFSCPTFAPGDPGYAAEVATFHLNVQHTPDLVVGVESTADVVEAVRLARAESMPVAVQAGGHGGTAVTSGMLITMHRMNQVSVDNERQTATFGGGARWSDVIAACAPFGLMPVIGSTTQVGATGYLLGGGISPIGRSHGYSADYVTSMTLVSGMGEILEASNFDNQDLFWALRGGKAGLGIVTEVTMRLVELPTMYAGSLVFDEAHLEPVLRGWLDWTTTADPMVTTSFATIDFPDMEMAPPPFRGKRMTFLRFAYPGDAERGAALAAPLRNLAPMFMDDLGLIPSSQIDRIHNDPQDPLPAWEVGAQFGELNHLFADEWLSRFGTGKRSPLLMVELRHGGGAQKIEPIEGTAVTGRDACYTMFLCSFFPPFFAEAAPHAAGDMLLATREWALPVMNVNLLGENPFAQPWSPQMTARIVAARQKVDPEGLFVARW